MPLNIKIKSMNTTNNIYAGVAQLKDCREIVAEWVSVCV